MDMIIEILRTEAVQYAIVFGVLYPLIKKLFVKVPKAELFYHEYKGAMINAIKMAEAEIPDDTENKALHRLDLALQYTVQLIETAEGKKVESVAEVAKLKSDISLVHHEVLDAK